MIVPQQLGQPRSDCCCAIERVRVKNLKSGKVFSIPFVSISVTSTQRQSARSGTLGFPFESSMMAQLSQLSAAMALLRDRKRRCNSTKSNPSYRRGPNRLRRAPVRCRPRPNQQPRPPHLFQVSRCRLRASNNHSNRDRRRSPKVRLLSPHSNRS